MFLSFRDEVESCLKNALKAAGIEADAELEESDHADLASSVSFKLASKLKKSPKEIAGEIAKHIRISDYKFIADATVSGPYINFFVNRSFLNDTIEAISEKKCDYGQLGYSDRIILEHTSTNPNGPLHVGHIRNSIIGDTLSRVLRKAGYDVETQYYVNDMGRQIAMVVFGLERYDLLEKKSDHAVAEVYISANRAIEKDHGLKAEVDGFMQKYEAGDKKIKEKFMGAVDLCLSGIRSTLERMNIKHDRFVWESDFVWSGTVRDIIGIVEQSRYSEIQGGALVLDLNEFGFEKEYVVKRSDGTSLYSTRDLAYHKMKAKDCDRVIDIFGADHKLISSQLVKVLEILGVKTPEIVIFEFVSLPEGSMSTRKGKFITTDELLDEVERAAYEEVDKRRSDLTEDIKRDIARSVGVGAIRYDIVRVSAEKSTTFDWKNALDFEKQGAPFIQYAHARCCSILRKSDDEPGFNPDLLIEKSEVDLIKKMSKFPLVIEIVSKDLKAHLIATYARELTELFNQFYRDAPVLSVEDELKKARLCLVDCTRIVICEALELMGIEAPDIM